MEQTFENPDIIYFCTLFASSISVGLELDSVSTQDIYLEGGRQVLSSCSGRPKQGLPKCTVSGHPVTSFGSTYWRDFNAVRRIVLVACRCSMQHLVSSVWLT